MSFLKRLFGGGDKSEQPAASAPEDYNGFQVQATPYQEGGQWQMCGVISKEIEGEVKQHRFVRADRFPSRDDAVQFTMVKARQIVDLNGTRIFS